MNRSLSLAAFAAGLLSIAWIGAGYVPGSPLALALVVLIGTFYLAGALELRRFDRASAGLARVLAATAEAPPALGPWLAQLPASLRPAVRLRVEGERVALPGPALAPYLAGLLVLLGMLGTFLGMVVTLKGTGLALENASDVDAIRASLAAPVKGLGLAFGTSVAGVSASAALGLMTALARRARRRVAQTLDASTGSILRGWSRAHQREESLRLLQAQAEMMPALVSQLQALVNRVDHQGQALHERLLASQELFQREARRAYGGLAESVGRSLETSLAESARLAAAAIEPAVRETMAGLERESATLRDALGAAVQRQIESVGLRLDATAAALAESWQTVLADQRRQAEATAAGLDAGLERFAASFEQRSTALLDGVAARMDRSTAQAQATWGQALERQQQSQQDLLRTVADAHRALEGGAAEREAQRQAAYHEGLAALGTGLQRQSEESGRALAERGEQICGALERSAQAITAQAESQARATIAEIRQLLVLASQAPQAAAEVVAELRRALSESLVHDNAVLEERNGLMATLGSLLDAVNHAGGEQRAAIDALVQASADLLERTGRRFDETVEGESRALQTAAAQVGAGAAEMASLGEGFGVAVQLFSRASEQLTAQLARIESALGASMARSDEQLAYSVAQAREIIDLTLGSHKQIVDDLQRLARAGVPA